MSGSWKLPWRRHQSKPETEVSERDHVDIFNSNSPHYYLRSGNGPERYDPYADEVEWERAYENAKWVGLQVSNPPEDPRFPNTGDFPNPPDDATVTKLMDEFDDRRRARMESDRRSEQSQHNEFDNLPDLNPPGTDYDAVADEQRRAQRDEDKAKRQRGKGGHGH